MFRSSRALFKLASAPPSGALVARASTRLPTSSAIWNRRVVFYSSKPPDPNKPIGKQDDERNARETLKSDPPAVSTQSSVRHLMEGSQSQEDDHDMKAELKHDIDMVKDTFRFKDVPRESRILGLAGTLPYLGTSLSTVFLSWDLNKQFPTGNSFYDSILVDHDTARYLLNLIEPIQLGYGAVIISFLGAIHWGLEYAEKTPHPERTRLRYGIGLAASVVAWPTLFLPIEYALTTQFLAFIALYFVDARAATRGWAPHWYGTYRFLLTAMVGLAIFVSLVGRAKIGQNQAREELQHRLDTPGLADHDTDWAKLEQEEKERIKKEKKKAEKRKEKEEQEKKLNELKEKKGHKSTGATKEDSEESDDNDGKGEDDDKQENKSEESEQDEAKEDAKNDEDDEDAKGKGDSKEDGDAKEDKKDTQKDEKVEKDKKEESKDEGKGTKDKKKDDDE